MTISKQKVQAMYQSGTKHYDFTTILFRLFDLRMKAYRSIEIMRIFLIFCILFFSCASNAGTTYWFLEELSNITSKNDCEPDILREKDPRYFVLTPEHMITWCKSKKHEGEYNLIALSSSTNGPWNSCSAFIPVLVLRTSPIWIDKYMDHYEKALPLSKYWYLNSFKNENMTMVNLSGFSENEAILYGFFDAGQILYCHKGKWLMSGYH